MLIDRTLSSISPSLTQNRDKEGRRRRGGTPVELASSTRFLPVCVQTQLSTDSTPRKQKASKIDFSKNSLAAIIIHKKHSNCSAQSEDTGSDGNLFKQWMKGEFPWFCFPYLGCLGQFKIGICQLTVTGDKSTKACNSVKVATSQGASLLLLPEMWNCPYSHAHFSEFAEDFNDKDGSPTFSMLSEVASCLGVTVVAGSIPERSSNLLYNTCCVFGPDGRLKAKHRKMHMFDINVPGDISFKESDTFSAGEEPTVVDTEFGLLGIGICHDIRFPELAMLYRERGFLILTAP